MSSLGTRKRISRISRRAIPEVAEAYRQGRISARRADSLLYLNPIEQREKISSMLSEQNASVRREKIAASILRKHLAEGRRDLVALREDLRIALSSPNISSHV